MEATRRLKIAEGGEGSIPRHSLVVLHAVTAAEAIAVTIASAATSPAPAPAL